ncbi:hypothetical protein V6Z11_A13G244800 [Gossypium hirsutum]
MIYGKLRGFEEEKKSPLLFFVRSRGHALANWCGAYGVVLAYVRERAWRQEECTVPGGC